MQPKIYPADEHEIDPAHVDADALTVLKKLHEAGHIAYLVGGGVRDLLVKKPPKDFDVSTSASPEEIKRLFQRQCLLIGRRFRLAHIRFGQKIIEVSTFRSGESGDELIVRDNQWGTPEEDARRRDFTINGLFLDPTHHQVIDYVGGWNDIHKGILRTIGDPAVRFKQDPVRMIRLLKFTARFGFQIAPETLDALQQCKSEVLKSSPARVLEELLRMLESGAAKPFIQQMAESGFLDLLAPWLGHVLRGPSGPDVYQLLTNVDELTRSSGRPLDRAVSSACWLFPVLDRELHIQFIDKGTTPHIGDVSLLTHTLIRGVAANSFPQFTKRLKLIWSFILTTQYRLTPFGKKLQARTKMLRHMDFPHALEFLKLRAMSHAELVPVLQEWTLLYEQCPKPDPSEIEEDDEEDGDRTSRRRRRRRPRYHNRSSPSHRQPHGH